MGVIPGNSQYMCWMCKFYPVAEDEPLPLPPETLRYCPIENGRKRAMRQACPFGSLDRERLSRSRDQNEPTDKETGYDETSILGLEEDSIEEAYVRCLETATDRGLVILGRARLNKEEVKALKDRGLIEQRVYGGVSRLFISEVRTKKAQIFGK